MSFYQHLLDATTAERNQLLTAPIIQDALLGHVTMVIYIAFLTQAYHHV